MEIIPSKTLDFSMLGFVTRNCLPAVELGERDALAALPALLPAPARTAVPA
ncbi:MAG: hypothetical protein M0D55_07895 [Elusimicrobiota bacterium]|nr:MAG: hypothetical protein M0D55_07895 [Elusimicrobiota bacterium]